MAESFQCFVMRLSLLGFAASFAVLLLRSRLARDTFARLLSIWRSLTALGRAVVCTFLLVGFLVADKTNGVNNLPAQQMNSPMVQLGGGSFQTGFTELTGLAGMFPRAPTSQTLVNLVDPVQTASVQNSFAERKAANWNVRGAWRDSFWLDFEDGWVFPCGTNHLAGVEVFSCGEVRAMPFDTNAVVSIDVSVEIVPGMSGFSYEHTPSNTYRFCWIDAAVNRDTNNLVSAAIELFRNGDVTVTTNGVATHLPRTLPFPHDGYGQDEEWVAANFSNGAEIADAGGYVAWVDSQVGAGLTNGLYKLTVTVAEDPPETTLVTVGDFSVAIANSGEYVFLLGKGVRYDLSASSDCATNFIYSVSDDVAGPMRFNAPLRNLQGESGEDGVWSSSSGELRLYAPFGSAVWHPTLSISPRKWHPSRADATRSFTATLVDLPSFVSPSYAWSTADASICSCGGATGRTATYTCHFPAADGRGVSLGLDVTLNGTMLHADYWYYIGYFSEVYDYEEQTGEGDGEYVPVPALVVTALPSVVFFEAGTTNVESADVGCFYLVNEAGTFELTLLGDAVSVMDQSGATVSSGYTWSTSAGVIGARHFLVESPVKSSSPSGTVFTVTFTPDEGTNTMSDASSVTFVEWETRTKASWPNDRYRRTLGVCETVYIKMNPSVLVDLDKTSASSTLRRKGKGSWVYCAPDNPAVDEISVPGFGALFSFHVLAPTGYDAKLKTIAVGSNIGPGDSGGYAMVFDLTVLPTNVSFYAIKIMEVGMSSTNAIGYFAEPRSAHFLAHATANVWSTVYKGNKCSDVAQMAVLPPPWGSGGSMSWPIPNEYTGNPGNAHGVFFCDTDQFFSVDADGTAREEKFGWFVEATTNRVFSYGRTTTP